MELQKKKKKKKQSVLHRSRWRFVLRYPDSRKVIIDLFPGMRPGAELQGAVLPVEGPMLVVRGASCHIFQRWNAHCQPGVSQYAIRSRYAGLLAHIPAAIAIKRMNMDKVSSGKIAT